MIGVGMILKLPMRNRSHGKATKKNDFTHLNHFMMKTLLSALTLFFAYSLWAQVPVAYYPFNGNSNDASGNNHDGSVFGATPAADRWSSSHSAYSFDGVNDYMELAPVNAVLGDNPQEWSVVVWFNSGDVSRRQDIVNDYTQEPPSTGDLNFSHFIDIVNGRIRANLRENDNDHLITGAALVSDRWYQVVYAASKIDGNAYLYLDGQLQGSVPINTSADYVQDDPLRVGSNFYAGSQQVFFYGLIDDLAYYDRMLTPIEVQQLYDPGLVAYYPFNGDARDASGNGNDGVVNGASLTTDRYGNPNSAYFFDGADDHIELVEAEDLLGSNPEEYSYNLWIKLDNTITYDVSIISDYNNLSYDTHDNRFGTLLVWDESEAELTAQLREAHGRLDGYAATYDARASLSPEQWAMVTVTVSKASGDLQIFLNGALINTVPFNTSIDYIQTELIRVGASFFGNQLSGLFSGVIDDLRFYDYELSDAEVSILYEAEKLTELEDDLLAYYPFNGNANDESGYGNDGIVSGASLTADRHGNSSSAYSFDGADDFIRVPSSAENQLGSGDFTVSAWFRSPTTDEGVIWNKRSTSSCSQAFGPTVGFSQTSSLNGNYLSAAARSGGTYRLQSSDPVADNQWHLVTWVRQGSNLTLYLDGAPESATTLAANENFNTALDLFIGKTIYCGGNHFEGDIDEFTIYGRALTPQQIQDLYDLDGLTTYYEDLDDDGFGNSSVTVTASIKPAGFVLNDGDCDDQDGAVYPGAPEVCDGIDNNCDGLVDDDDPLVQGQSIWYADMDGDGFGNASASMLACDQPDDHVSDNTDCDDSNASINPGAAEICDGIDNNCDGLVDDDDPLVEGQSTWYADTDGDGFGDPNMELLACLQPAGYVAYGSDNCPLDPNKIDPGACGCGIVDEGTDADGDGIDDGCDDVFNLGSATDAIENVIISLDIKKGLENALTAKLQEAESSCASMDPEDAVGVLGAFINQVEAKRGKDLTEEEANGLIASAQAVISAIQEGTSDCSGGAGARVQSPKVSGPWESTSVSHRNYPNPFSNETTIYFSISEPTHVTLTIYNLYGRKVRQLVDGPMGTGSQEILFNAKGLSAGIYFYHLDVAGHLSIGKMLISGK